MNKERREEIVGEWRDALRPLLAEKVITQEEVAERLAGYYGGSIDQTNVSRWLMQTTPQPRVMSALMRMLSEVREGAWPGYEESERSTTSMVREAAPALVPGWIQEAWLSDARAAERRADALLEFAVAARLAEENARDRNRMLSPDERALRTAAQGVEAVELAQRQQTEQASRSVGPQQPPPPDRPVSGTGRGTAGGGKN